MAGRGMKVLDPGGWGRDECPCLPVKSHRLSSKLEKKNLRSSATKRVIKSKGDKYQKNPKWEKVSGWASIAIFLSKLKDSTFGNSMHM